MSMIHTSKKGKIVQGLFVVAGLLYAAGAFAATVSWSPASVNVDQGKTVTLTVAIDPKDVKAYTVKLEVKYPADMLEVQAFAFASGWMPLAQPGYDSIDNAGGTLVKTAGYPGGLASPASFGTITFKAKKTGSASVQVTANSLALGSSNQNLMTGLPVAASVSIKEAASAPKTQTEQKPAEKASGEKPAAETITPSEVDDSPEESVVPSGQEPSAPSPLTAAVATPLSVPMMAGIVVVIVLALVGAVWYFLKRKKA